MSFSFAKEKPGVPLTQRLTEMGNSGTPTVARAAKLLAQLPSPPPLGKEALSRIETRLTLPPSAPPSILGAVLRRLGWGLTATAVTVLAFLFGVRFREKQHLKPAPTQAVQSAQPAPALLPNVPMTTVAAEPATEPATVLLADSAARAASRPSRLSARPHLASASATPPTTDESALLAESRLLGQALHELHQEHKAEAALHSLASYFARFEQGLLREEAQAARIDALLVLKRSDEALNLLDRSTFLRLGRGGELRAVRGELRATRGRCKEAVADFSWALAHEPTPGTTERALYGRGACRVALKEFSQARADFADYLQRFPSGRLAEAAKQGLLRSAPSQSDTNPIK